MTDTSIIFKRLKQVRKLMKLNQTEMAEICGVRQETWSRYENGSVSPGMEVLAAMAAAGADVQYILTGIPSANALNQDEERLLTGYRAMNAQGKAGMLGMVSGIKQTKHTIEQQFNAPVGQVTHGDIHNQTIKMPKS